MYIHIYIHISPTHTRTHTHTCRPWRHRRVQRLDDVADIRLRPLPSREHATGDVLAGVQVMPTSPFSRLRAYGDGADDESALKYIAHALDVHDHVAGAGDHGLLLLEDDLLPGSADVGALRRRLQETLRLLPPSADMLYLEYCFETCSHLRYPPPQARADGYAGHYPDGYERHYASASGRAGIARAYAPSCCAAVYFTARGARRVAALILPAFDVIDRMYQYLVHAGLLEAYVAVPPLFYQVGCGVCVCV